MLQTSILHTEAESKTAKQRKHDLPVLSYGVVSNDFTDNKNILRNVYQGFNIALLNFVLS